MDFHKVSESSLFTDVTSSAGVEYAPACTHCGGLSYVYEMRPYITGTRNWGNVEEQVPCPVCNPTCPTCAGKGVVGYALPHEHPDFGKLFPCPTPGCEIGKVMHERMQRALLTTAQLPNQFKAMTFRSWDRLPKAAKEGKRLARAAAELYANAEADNFYITLAECYAKVKRPLQQDDARRNSLVFQGPVGMGKSGLAATIANAVAARQTIGLRYLRVRDLIAMIQRTYRKDYVGLHGDEILQDICAVPLLILDEMNLAQESENRQDIMETVIRHRYNHLLPTIITLNSDRDELEAEWGIRTATAVRAMAHWFLLGGSPLRNEGYVVEAY